MDMVNLPGERRADRVDPSTEDLATKQAHEKSTVSDTGETSKILKCIPPLISISSLRQDMERMRFAGFWPAKVECGPLVYELLVNWTIYGQNYKALDAMGEERRAIREERMRRMLMEGASNMTFNDMPVVLCEDVPDGNLWPSRERCGHVAPPFVGTEARDECREV